MMHYKQIYDSKEFIKFDFGQEENTLRYGGLSPQIFIRGSGGGKGDFSRRKGRRTC